MADANGQVEDPFEGVLAGGDQPLRYQTAQPAEDADDPFAKALGGQTVDPTGSSFLGSTARGVVRGVLPAAGNIAGAGLGAARGAAIGAMIPGLGETGVGEFGGAIIGGLIGGYGGSFVASKAQDYALSKAPESWVDALGQSDRQQRLDEEQHPVGSFLGGLIPYAVTMNPLAGGRAALLKGLPENATLMQRIAASPLTSRLFGGGIMGALELGQEEASGQGADWRKVALATGFGMVFNRPNGLGELIENAGPRALGQMTAAERIEASRIARERANAPTKEPNIFPPTPESDYEALGAYQHQPTLNEANVYSHVGPGGTEATFMGQEVRNPTTQATADSNLQEEHAAIGPMDTIDIDALARRSERDLFARYDALREQRDTFAAQMLQAGVSGNTHGMTAASLQLDAINTAMREIAPEVGAARRRAAERTGAETIPPTPVQAEPEDVVAAAPATAVQGATPTLAEAARPVKPLAEQMSFIAQDVAQKVAAAGRPQDEANDIGTLVANRFAVRAAQFQGALGMAEDLYRREGPDWKLEQSASPHPADVRAKARSLGVENLVTALRNSGASPKEIEAVINKKMTADEIKLMAEPTKRGSYVRGNPRGVISLFTEHASPATAIHELGHDFLEQMRRDSTHEAVPTQLRADWEAVKKATKIEDDSKPIGRTSHEQFARWFEQYLYEGNAPSKELAGVFERFKNWLAQVYKTVRDLVQRGQAEISPEIRQVFDRLLADESLPTTISQEAARHATLPEIHVEEAAKVDPAVAGAAAERIGAERAEAAPPPEVAHEIVPAEAQVAVERGAAEPAGEAGGGAGGLREVGRGGGEAGVEPGRGEVGLRPGAEREGGNGPAAESGGVSGGQPGQSAARPESGDFVRNQPLAPGPADTVGRTEKLVDKAGNFKRDNINTTDEIWEAIKERAAVNNQFLNARRDVVPFALSQQLAKVMGRSGTQELVDNWVRGQAFNAHQILGLIDLIDGQSKDVGKLSQIAKGAKPSDEDVVNFTREQARLDMILQTTMGGIAESARAMNAIRQLQSKMKNIAVDFEKITGKPLWQKAAEMKLVSAYDDPAAVAYLTSATTRHSFGRMLLEYWVNGLISGTATHTTYAIGNMLLSLDKALLETPVAAGLGALRGPMGRDTSNIVHIGEAAQRLRGFYRGFAPAQTAALEALRSGVAGRLPGEKVQNLPFQLQGAPPLAGKEINPHATMADTKAALYGVTRGINEAVFAMGKILQAAPEGEPNFSFRYSPLGANPDVQIGAGVLPTGQMARLPSRAIASIHTFFKATNGSMDKHALVYREAMNEGIANNWTEAQIHARMADLTNNPPEWMMEKIAATANELSLMAPAGEFTRRVMAVTNWAPNIPGLGETPILKFIDPFVHLASNIIDQTFVKRTPLGLLSGELRRDLFGANGPAAQDMAQARMIVGSAMVLGFGLLAMRGVVTGSGPIDKTKAAAWRLAGYQPHSIRIGDTWYQMNRLGPLGMLMGTAADLYDVAHAASKEDMLQAGNLLTRALYHNVLDESFMRGPAEAIGAINDPGRNGERWIQNFASSFVPYSVGLAQISRAADPYSRQARTVLDAIKLKIPGLSETLLPRRDIWGEPIPSHDALVSAGVTAIYESKISADPVNIALNDLGIGFGAVDRSIRNVKLTDTQYDRYVEIAGRLAKTRLDMIVTSPDWRSWPPGIQAEVATEVVRQSREVARNYMMGLYTQIMADSVRQRLTKFGEIE